MIISKYFKAKYRNKEFMKKIPLSKTKKEVMKELTDFLMSFNFIIEEKIIKKDFKLLKLKNNYDFYNEIAREIYVVRTPILTEDNYELMLEKLRDIKTIIENYIGATAIVIVDEYNDVFEKYLKEFCFINFFKFSRKHPTFLLNLGICFKDKSIYIGSLNEDTQYERGREAQQNLYKIVKDFNEGTFKFKEKIKKY